MVYTAMTVWVRTNLHLTAKFFRSKQNSPSDYLTYYRYNFITRFLFGSLT